MTGGSIRCTYAICILECAERLVLKSIALRSMFDRGMSDFAALLTVPYRQIYSACLSFKLFCFLMLPFCSSLPIHSLFLIIIIITVIIKKGISKAPIYHTRWEHRAF